MFDFLTRSMSDLFSSLTGKNKLTEKNIHEVLEKIRQALLQADVPLSLADQFIEQVRSKAVGAKVLRSLNPEQQFTKIVHDNIKTFLSGADAIPFTFATPSIVMLMGLQGSGKTTTIAKLVHSVQQERKGKKALRIMVASVDFYRPAAIDQLEILAKQVSVTMYRALATHVVDAAQEIVAHYQREKYDLLFLDTAGRLHVDASMLEELKMLDGVVHPTTKILVLDAMTGQESLRVAQAFDAIGFTGAILTKMDSETRGGAAFSFRYALNKPILFVGTGEKVADLELFYPERMADRILGMGDVLSFVEKAEQTIKKEEQEAAMRSFQKNAWTLQDFADQLAMMSKMGPFGQLVKYMPGAGQLSTQQIQEGERAIKRSQAIISSMTAQERMAPKILNDSRKERIARGAGVAKKDIDQLLQGFEQSQQYAKLLKKFGRGNNLFK